MLTRTTYPLNVALIRRDLTTPPPLTVGFAGPHTTRASGYGLHQLVGMPTDTQLTIIFNLNDLYVQGFIAGDRTSAPYVFRDSGYSINTPRRLNFASDYGSLGLDRSSAFTLNLDGVNGAVYSLANVSGLAQANGLKSACWKLAVAFAEAVRFDDVLTAIVHDTPISDLDWTKHKNASKVRVVKSATG